jgi:hypothetical protein
MIKQILILLMIPLILSYSQSGVSSKFYTDRSVSYSAKSPGDKSEISFKVFSGEEKKYEFSRMINYDEPFPSLQVFEDGSAALIYSFDGRVERFNMKGKFEGELNLFKEGKADYERSVYSSVSGDLLVLGISGLNLNNCEIIVLNNYGNLINRFNIDSDYLSGILISQPNNLIAVSTYSWEYESLIEVIKFYSVDGKLNDSISGQFSSAKIVEDALIGFTNKSCFYTELSNLSDIVYSTADNGEILLDMILHDYKIYLAASKHPVLSNGEWLFNGATVTVFDRTLKKKSVLDIQAESAGSFFFSIDNGKLNINADDARFLIE